MIPLAAIAVALLLQSQTPVPPARDARGLLSFNKDFYELAARTGADFYFWAAGEFASSRLEIPVTHDAVSLADGTIVGRRTFEVPVESGARSLIVFAGVQRKDLATIVRPDETVATHGQPGVTFQTFQHMVIATIDLPAAGTWRFELDGEGVYAVTAHLRPREKGITLDRAEFADDGTCSVLIDGTVQTARLGSFAAMEP